MPHVSLKAEELFLLGGFAVTNTILLSAFIFLLVLGAAFMLSRRLALVPGGAQNITEVVVDGALGLMDSVLGTRAKSEKYLPLVATIFVLVLISNWSGLIPGVGSIGFYNELEFAPLLRAPSSDLNFTLAIALISVVAANAYGIRALGFGAHLKKFINFSGPIPFFIGILELISEFAKVVSFSFRLFGNIFAGEVLLIIIGFLAPYGAPIPFLFLEIFVGFIQAFVFAMLSLVFVAMATIEHGGHH